MTPHEIVTILTAVERFPFLRWQSEAIHTIEDVRLKRLTWKTDEDQSFNSLLQSLSVGAKTRFDPFQPWAYPSEDREGVPVWARIRYRYAMRYRWMQFDSRKHAINYVNADNGDLAATIVACDPRNLDVPPPVEFMNIFAQPSPTQP